MGDSKRMAKRKIDLRKSNSGHAPEFFVVFLFDAESWQV